MTFKQHWALASEWDCPSPEPCSSAPEAPWGQRLECGRQASSSTRHRPQSSGTPSQASERANLAAAVASSGNVLNANETKGATSQVKTIPLVSGRKEEQAPTTWRVLGPIDRPHCQVTERIFNGKKIVEVDEIDIASNYLEAGLQGEISDDHVRQSTVTKDVDEAMKTYEEVLHRGQWTAKTISRENFNPNSKILAVTSTRSNPTVSSVCSLSAREKCDTFTDTEGNTRGLSAPTGGLHHESGCSPAGHRSASSTLSALVHINQLKGSVKSQVCRPTDCVSQRFSSTSRPGTSIEKGVSMETKDEASLSASPSVSSDGQAISEGALKEPGEEIDVMSNVSRKFLTFSKVNVGASCSTDVSSREAARMTDYYLKEANKKVVMPKMLIKRPHNQFLLFSHSVRSSVAAQYPDEASSAISARIAAIWKKLPENEKAEWERRAQEAREEHERRYPGYNFPAQEWKHQRLLYRIEKEKQRSIFNVTPRK